MDQGFEDAPRDSLVVTGLGAVIAGPNVTGGWRREDAGARWDDARAPILDFRSLAECIDPTPYLKVQKQRKYMGTQDDLAVVAAGRAIESAGLGNGALGERAGLYLVVGHIPFGQDDIDALFAASLENGRFSMPCFSTAGLRAVNGLLTFRCLPNMPAFHISVNFDIQGPYFVSYPGPGQLYLVLEEASAALWAGDIDVALVGGVAHQRNFLVEHHFSRVDHPVPADRLLDAGGCLVVETAEHARRRGAPMRGALVSFETAYLAHSPFDESIAPLEQFEVCSMHMVHSENPSRNVNPDLTDALGPASLPALLSAAANRGPCRIQHRLQSRDGIRATSHWELEGSRW